MPLRLRVGLGLPPEFLPKDEELRFQLPAQPGNHLVSFECVPMRRGLFHIDGCYFEIESPAAPLGHPRQQSPFAGGARLSQPRGRAQAERLPLPAHAP